MIRIGVIGCGHWGPNIIRNFVQMPHVEMRKVADLNFKQLNHIKCLYPTVETTTDYKEIVSDTEIDAVAIATPVNTHMPFAVEALENGKHVFVEKPMAGSIADAETMVQTAVKKELTLMVGHTFEYHAAVLKMKEIIEEYKLNRVVVASCSPSTHEALFQETMREAGLNPYLFEMANIRNHCSWVHRDDHAKASEKANRLIKIALGKTRSPPIWQKRR